MNSFRLTPEDFWDDTFADFKMARELSKLDNPDTSLSMGTGLNDYDEPSEPVQYGKTDRSRPIDHVYWRKKMRPHHPDRPTLKTLEIWTENSNFPTKDSEQAYKYPSPSKVLESMVKIGCRTSCGTIWGVFTTRFCLAGKPEESSSKRSSRGF